MNKIPTAEEFLKQEYERLGIKWSDGDLKQWRDEDLEILKGFANLYLDNAIKEWSEYLTWCSLEYTTPLTYIDWLKDYKLRNKLN